jgi:glycosyltransferase involved in cell wall biosynthesis
MRFFLLTGFKIDKEDYLLKGLTDNGFDVELLSINQFHIKNALLKFVFILSLLRQAVAALVKSARQDVLITQFDLTGVLCYWLSKLFFTRRKIVAINILLKPAKTKNIKATILRILYKKALEDKDFVSTVTSQSVGNMLNEYLQANIDFELLHDNCGRIMYLDNEFKDCGKTLFCGGKNGRDWDFICKLASRMPDYKFSIVMPSYAYKKCFESDNCHFYFDIPTEEFFSLLSQCSFVVLPLTTTAPAGLIVAFAGALAKKVVVVTDTVAVREYFDDDSGCIIDNNLELYSNTITECQKNTQKRIDIGHKACEKIKSIASPEAYVDTLSLILKKRILKQ